MGGEGRSIQNFKSKAFFLWLPSMSLKYYLGAGVRWNKIRPCPQLPFVLRSSRSGEEVDSGYFVQLAKGNLDIFRHRAELVYQLYLDAGHSLPSPLQVFYQSDLLEVVNSHGSSLQS